ncbi:hypothetical protein [Chitinophaga nivalis]|uniref:Uncharacterized protein n=1 Tax=Chitinophaga nivalis TaxID=2991709 RepID=A0ABT3IKA3_9BACT|nr:hypothetical protein [Chitinophaga nivalis]MCW3466115.1 hypothetical protein [Chitinophaga nivalis]MCW3484194.1 hypothetical protein [Chitinophaga nivalis]
MNAMLPSPTVKEALQDFYQQHQYGEEGGTYEKFAWIKFGFFSIPMINTAGRRKHVYLHDIHHIVTGYDTSWKGESSISAWEIAAGGWGNVYVIWIMALWAMGLGVLFYPKSTLQSFRRGLTMHNALTCGLSKQDMYQLSVPALRNVLSNQPRRHRSILCWMMISLVVFITPFIVGILFIGLLVYLL